MQRWKTILIVAVLVTLGLAYADAQPPDAPPCAGPAQARGHGPGPMHELLVQADKNSDRQITFEELTAVKPDFPKERFEAMDHNGDGVLSPADRPMHEGHGPRGPQDGAGPGGPGREALIERLRAADKNNDQQVSLEEFNAAFPDAPEDAFKRRDRNADGVLSRADLPEGGPEGRRQGPPIERIRAADKNEDGQVTREEWNAEFPHAPEPLFDRIDRNGDGVLTPEDAPQGRPGPPEGKGPAGARPDKPRQGTDPAARLRKADTNNDGQVTAEEFKTAFPNAEEGRFQKLDRNQDGVLSEADRGRPVS